MATDTYKLLDITVLQPNPFQPRGKIHEEEVRELADSIKSYGVLEPIVVAHTPAGYQIIAGERRWRASQLAGLTEVPVIIKETTPKGMLEMALIENVQRINLNAIERAKAFQQLLHDFQYSAVQLAHKVGKSEAFVSNSLRLLNLPDAVKDGLVGKQITEGHARALAGLEDKKLIIDVYKRLLKENASVRRAEELVRQVKQAKESTSAAPGKRIAVDPNLVSRWQETIASLLSHSSPKVKLSRSTRQTRITITLRGNLDETQKDLEELLSQVKSSK
ncbi:ParB/RepB/Spo0J family partition protein [Candidatus Woesebacteria bacterium]|nr:ParB/RepB/Spo0J family partition protein [Candidatus Woesebacteria bacterium]